MPDVIHISADDAARDFAGVLERVRAGTEVIIEANHSPVAIIRTATPIARSISESLALLPAESPAVTDESFAKDVAAAVDAHREPLSPVEWD